MKRAISILTVLALLLALFGCSGGEGADEGIASDSIGQAAISSVEETLEAVKTYDVSKLGELTNAAAEDLEGFSEEYSELVKNTFGKLKYKIMDVVTLDEKTVNVEAYITAVDMEALFNDALDVVQKKVKDSPDEFSNKTTEELTKYIIDTIVECADKEDIKTVSGNVEVTVNEVDGKWISDLDDEDLNLLFGNLDKAVNLMGQN